VGLGLILVCYMNCFVDEDDIDVRLLRRLAAELKEEEKLTDQQFKRIGKLGQELDAVLRKTAEKSKKVK
jgi:hypothetical protein